jgi:hypothetical protein
LTDRPENSGADDGADAEGDERDRPEGAPQAAALSFGVELVDRTPSEESLRVGDWRLGLVKGT